MDLQQLIESITPEIYDNLKRAVELGKWPDGSRLTIDQREHSIRAVIAYDARHKAEEDRVGYVAPKKSKEPCSSKSKPSDVQPLKWQA
jgi:uncharacterized protein YeaC (DUF1315 family)|tara:strand:- start:9007 stop:9270 length:264 start_codon:yes stop_codon:yes gene_type:complete